MSKEGEESTGAEDLLGYPSVAELAKAKRSSDVEAKRIAEENKALRDQLVAMSAVNQPTRQAGPLDRLTEYGVPADAIVDLVRAEAGKLVQETFEPIVRGVKARANVLGRHPEYAELEGKIAGMMDQDPEFKARYERAFTADPEFAMEAAILKFGKSRRRSKDEEANGDTGRVEATLPGSQNSGTREKGANEYNDLLSRAQEHFQKTGDPRPYAKARLRSVIPDEFLNKQ